MAAATQSARPAAVIFDMDGLLFDSEALYHDAILAAARELGHRFTTADFLLLVGRPWPVNRAALQAHIGPSGDVEAFRAAWSRHYERMKGALAIKPGAVSLLDRLDTLGLPRAICTSSGHDEVRHNLALHGLTNRFHAIIAAGDYAVGKPAPDPFLRAAAVLGVAPQDCWALEDSHNGVHSAAAAGMRTIMVPDLLPATEEIRSLCHHIAADLHAVRKLLR
ncbi:HAD family hydrolase [Roseomonas haemaphysalidis]|uniref:HAD family phosphatase n=1 Tax=Roseomonas haemaphysalidis TaxID=2768162 RepID=A0ABS3KQK2_9PROT|nr:HAD family phosphatase [Roseomonas haemaphysalidis]MBO1079307.1 HAD family phosphatase [Roseomonas haemaphysalidis]